MSDKEKSMIDLLKLDDYSITELQSEIDRYKKIVKDIRKTINKKKKIQLQDSLIYKQGV